MSDPSLDLNDATRACDEWKDQGYADILDEKDFTGSDGLESNDVGTNDEAKTLDTIGPHKAPLGDPRRDKDIYITLSISAFINVRYLHSSLL